MSARDITFESHGSIALVRANTDRGREWLDEHVAFEHWFGGAGVVEPRYASPIIEGATHAGLQVVVQ